MSWKRVDFVAVVLITTPMVHGVRCPQKARQQIGGVSVRSIK
jgi:hypothetical protein